VVTVPDERWLGLWRDSPQPAGSEPVEVGVWSMDEDLPAGARRPGFVVLPYLDARRALPRLGSLRGLEVVQSLTAGYDHVLPHLPAGVTLCTAAGVHDASTAELAVGLAIAGLRGIGEFARAQVDGAWRAGTRPALADRRVLLIGAGSVGAAIADRLAPFEVTVTRVASRARDDARGHLHGTGELALLLPEHDVVVLAVPLTDATRGLVDAAFLAAMPDGALLVNVARGPVVVTDALLVEVSTGRLLAALDVTDPEPLPPEHPLWRAPGLLISPHVGGDTTAFPPRARRLLRSQLERWVAGQPLANVVAGPAR
jgi:phosphoglycerate dehydrogenase-like enzyme